MSVIDLLLKLRNKEYLGSNLKHSDSIPMFHILIVGLCGISVTSTFFYLINEVPVHEFIITSWVLFGVFMVAFKLTATAGGDDQ